MLQIIGIILLLVSIASLAYGIKEVLVAEESKRWPVVNGIIIHSQIDRIVKNESAVYRVNVRYSYNANGVIYENSRIRFMYFATSFLFMAKKLINRYQLNSSVKVHCNPSDFKNSVLEPGFNSGFVIFFGLCSIFLITSLYFLTK